MSDVLRLYIDLGRAAAITVMVAALRRLTRPEEVRA